MMPRRLMEAIESISRVNLYIISIYLEIFEDVIRIYVPDVSVNIDTSHLLLFVRLL